MPTDIYTLRAIVNDSEEHVLPQSLGGRLGMMGRLDRSTNSQLGLTIDTALEEALRPIRVPLDAKHADGRSPRALTQVPGADGKQYRVDPGGVVVTRPHVKTTRLEGGGLQIEATVADEVTVRDMLRKHARSTGEDLNLLVARIMETAKHNRIAAPALEFNASLWQTDCYRATAKIAANLLATDEAALFCSDGFDRIRSVHSGHRRSTLFGAACRGGHRGERHRAARSPRQGSGYAGGTDSRPRRLLRPSGIHGEAWSRAHWAAATEIVPGRSVGTHPPRG